MIRKSYYNRYPIREAYEPFNTKKVSSWKDTPDSAAEETIWNWVCDAGECPDATDPIFEMSLEDMCSYCEDADDASETIYELVASKYCRPRYNESDHKIYMYLTAAGKQYFNKCAEERQYYDYGK